MKSMSLQRGEQFLDMGSGTGVVGIYAAMKGATVVAVDISEQAVRVTDENADLNGVSVKVVNCDLFSRVDKKFDVVAFNAPYTRLKKDGVEDRRCQDSAADSRVKTVRKFLRELPLHLTENGRGYLVLSSKSPMAQFAQVAEQARLVWTVVRSKRESSETVYVIGLSLRRDDIL
jgi:release factor glutamine methyltransferase